MDRDQLRIEALKLAHLDIYPGIKGDPAAVIERAGVYAKWLLTEHDTDAKGPDYLIRQQEFLGQLEYAKQLRSKAATFDANMETKQFLAGQFQNRQGDASS